MAILASKSPSSAQTVTVTGNSLPCDQLIPPGEMLFLIVSSSLCGPGSAFPFSRPVMSRLTVVSMALLTPAVNPHSFSLPQLLDPHCLQSEVPASSVGPPQRPSQLRAVQIKAARTLTRPRDLTQRLDFCSFPETLVRVDLG